MLQKIVATSYPASASHTIGEVFKSMIKVCKYITIAHIKFHIPIKNITNDCHGENPLK